MLKVCGLTRMCDLRLALSLGADRVGVIVEIGRSPRSLSREAAALLLRASEGRGVVVTELDQVEALLRLAERIRPAALQLHAGPPPEVVAGLVAELAGRAEVWPVLGVPADPAEAEAALPELVARAKAYAEAGAQRCLLDTRAGGHSGGTGRTADWEAAARVAKACPVPVILAGGLTPRNAAEALRATGAAGLDVNSGVERSPGVKDAALLRALFEALRERPAA